MRLSILSRSNNRINHLIVAPEVGDIVEILEAVTGVVVDAETEDTIVDEGDGEFDLYIGTSKRTMALRQALKLSMGSSGLSRVLCLDLEDVGGCLKI